MVMHIRPEFHNQMKNSQLLKKCCVSCSWWDGYVLNSWYNHWICFSIDWKLSREFRSYAVFHRNYSVADLYKVLEISSWYGQEMFSLALNWKLYYCVHRIPTPDLALSRLDLIQTSHTILILYFHILWFVHDCLKLTNWLSLQLCERFITRARQACDLYQIIIGVLLSYICHNSVILVLYLEWTVDVDLFYTR